MDVPVPLEKIAMMHFKVCLERQAAMTRIEQLEEEVKKLKEGGQNGGETKDSEGNKP